MTRLSRVLMYGGAAAAVGGLAQFHASLNDYGFQGSARFAWSMAYLAFIWLAAYSAGLPDTVESASQGLGASVAAAGASALGVSAVQLATGDALLPRFVVFGTALVLVPWFWVTSLLALRARARAKDRDRILVVGGEVDTTALVEDLRERPEKPALLVDTMQAREAAVTAAHEPLIERVRSSDASVLVLASDAQGDESIVAQAERLHESGMRVRTLTRFYEEWLGKLPVSELERVSLMFDIRELHRERYGRVKRLIDLALSVPGTGAFLVAVPFVLAGNIVANRGPLFYRQQRVGRNGEHFDIVKFRTMRPAGDRLVNEWTSEDDPRITRFGHLLRVTHIDELPQIVNILLGHLSVVGPRPEQPHYVDELTEKLPFYGLRHLVKPGLTGWAQVKYGYAGNESDALEKLQYEFYYLRHQGFALELRILGRTLRSVLGGHGR